MASLLFILFFTKQFKSKKIRIFKSFEKIMYSNMLNKNQNIFHNKEMQQCLS